MADMKVEVQEFDVVDSPADMQPDDELNRREARVVRKIDLYLMPTLLILMLLGFLDRGNIGFAASQGMIKDIGLKGKQLNVRGFPSSTTLSLTSGDDDHADLSYRSPSRFSTSSTFWRKCHLLFWPSVCNITVSFLASAWHGAWYWVLNTLFVSG